MPGAFKFERGTEEELVMSKEEQPAKKRRLLLHFHTSLYNSIQNEAMASDDRIPQTDIRNRVFWYFVLEVHKGEGIFYPSASIRSVF